MEMNMKKDDMNAHNGIIRSWTLTNFKSVKQASVELAPLTIVVGRNSSGKSSLIQSILLMAQNARAGMNREGASRKLDLNGALVNLGTFNEIVNDSAKRQKIEIGGVVRLDEEERRVLFGRLRGMVNRTERNPARISKDEQLKWHMELKTSSKDENSGFANVLNSFAEYQVDGEKVERITAKEHWGDYGSDKYKFPQFDFDSNGKLQSFKSYEDDYNFVSGSMKLEAVSYKMGLPFSGLLATTRMDDFMNKQRRLWTEELRQSILREVQMRRLPTSGQKSSSLYENQHQDVAIASLEEASDLYMNKVVEIFKGIENGDLTQWEDASTDPNYLVKFSSIPFYAEIFEQNEDGTDVHRVPLREIAAHMHDRNLSTRDLILEVQQQASKFWEELDGRISSYLGGLPVAQANCLVLPEEKERNTRLKRRSDDDAFKTSWAVTNFQASMMGLVYLGPLRENPKHLYERDSSIPYPQLPLGKKGELLAKRLFENDVREYPLPNGKVSTMKDEIGLRDAVNQWLIHLGLASTTGIEVNIEDLYGYRVRVDGRGLPAMGTGVSQVLPVITLCLMLRKGGIAMFEEPELHLNPGIQQKLADFFLEICKSGRQIIAETHSEYIVTRLRRRAAESLENRNAFTFVFTELDEESGTSYRNVSPGDDGMITDWPKGFFDQVSGDVRALLLIAAENKEKKDLEK
jgi:predicted ATPase